MEWSFALLSAREQVLLRRLSAFAGTFTLEAAEAVCAGDPLEPEDILDGVAALVDRSLVEMNADRGVARYRLLETVRQYAAERLDEAGERDALETAHATHYLRMAAELAPRIVGGTAGAGAMARLGAEQDDLRAAMAATLRRAAHDPRWAEAALRLADHLFWFWYGAGHWLRTRQFAEARRFTAAALEAGRDADPLLRARAHMAAGLAAHPQGKYEEARTHFEQSRALAEAHGDPELAIMARAKTGAALLMLGDVVGAWALLDAAWDDVVRTPPAVLYGFVAVWRTLAALERGDAATARACMLVMERVGRDVDNTVTVAHANAFLGRIAVLGGDLDEASTRLQAALHLHHDLGDWWGLSLDLEWLSALAAARGRHADAARFAGAVDALRERVGIVLYPVDRPHRERRVERGRARLGDAYDAHVAEGRAMGADALAQLAADDSVQHTAEFRAAAGGGHGCAPRCAPDRLRVRALGALEVCVGDRVVPSSAWGSARPRELLAYLLLHPEGRTKDQVGLAFWPDASPAQLRNNFHVTLHRLRRALGSADWVTLVGDRYQVDPALVESFDALEFERDVAAARRALVRQREGAVELLERALAAYRGDLLDGEPAGDWHLEHRERLQRLHVEGLMDLAGRFLLAGEPARAAEAYRGVLARDDLREDALQGLMRCHAALGERSQALRAYERFATRLRHELDALPAAETARMASRLQTGASP
jgi:DNA-binding SARP family transcriptional activator